MERSLVQKVQEVVHKELQIDDEAISEFLVAMGMDAENFNEFRAKLDENDAPFEEGLQYQLYNLIEEEKVVKKKVKVENHGEQKRKQESIENSFVTVKKEPREDSITETSAIKRKYTLKKELNHKEKSRFHNSDKEKEYKKQKIEYVAGVDEFGRSIETRAKYEDSEFELDENPVVGKVYKGKVTGIQNYGAFIRLQGIKFAQKKRAWQGLCHISQFSHSRINHPTDIVQLNETVFVKVIKSQGNKVDLSMKDVNQSNGELQEEAPEGRYSRFQTKSSEPKRKLTSPERWELRQLVASGAISIKDHPELEEDLNEVVAAAEIDAEDDLDVAIEVNQKQPSFLKNEKKNLPTTDVDTLKILAKPEGSLGRAAMTGSDLARKLKEKRLQELREKRLKKGNSNNEADIDSSEWQREINNSSIKYGKRSEMSIEDQRKSLPVYQMRSELLKLVHENQFLVIVGETGSGKTTQVTQFLMEEGYANKKMIGCTQPRRVAAVSVAKRVAQEVGCKLGNEVGYYIRFDDRTSPITAIKYMTDGMLEREALNDPYMTKYSVIMLDEAHERTIATDVLFALLKKAAQHRPDLRIIVTSATLDSAKFSQYFNNCPVLKVPGRTFPVEVLYTKEPELDYLEACLDTVLQVHALEGPGDILVFLTGQEEIDMACEALFNKVKGLGDSISELMILPVYSSLPSEVQSRIFEPTPPGKRKCVIATNIAETSITIDGIIYVVDPGFVKMNAYDPKLGMDSLIVTPISQAQANQRAGRAGRTGPGKCYRLYTENAFNTEMLPNTVPEIQRQNLSNTILMLKAMGINDLLNFEFMDPPPVRTMMAALEDLYNLTALDDEGKLTNLGTRMADFPMDPSLSRSLITASETRCSDELCTIVAMLSVQNVFYRPKNKQQHADLKKSKFHSIHGDHLTLLNIYNAWVQNEYSKSWCEENYVQERALKRAREVRKQLITIFLKHRMSLDSCGRDFDRVRKALCSGFFKNSAKKDAQEAGAYKTIIEDTPVYLHPSSALFGKRAENVIYHTLVMTSREYMHCVTTIEPKWLVEVAPTFFKIGNSSAKRGKIYSLQRKNKTQVHTTGNVLM